MKWRLEHRAGCFFSLHLIARNARIDSLRRSRGRLVQEFRVGEQRPRHRNHIAVARGQNLLCDLGCVDPVRRHQRQRHLHKTRNAIYIHLYIYLYLYIYISISVSIYLSIYPSIYIHIYTYLSISILIYIHACIHTCMHAYIHSHIYTRKCCTAQTIV